jgi:PAS domain S-box-containing protein
LYVRGGYVTDGLCRIISKAGIIAQLNEARRDALFAEYGVLDTEPEAAFDDIVCFAGALCETPIALISLVERDRQWFKARSGLDALETSRELSFCKHAMLGSDIMVIPDATEDPRFADNALVTGEPHIRFYAGAPLTSPEGVPLGSLCVIDRVPRDALTPLQAQGLTVLAAQVMNLMEARRHLFAKERHDEVLAESVEKFRILADTMPQMVWSTLPDGYHDYYNKRWYAFTGMIEGSTDGEGWNGMFHPDDQDRAWERWRHSLESGEPYEIEYRLRHHSGEYRWTLGRALPMRDAAGRITRWFGTCTDIHDHKKTLEERELVAHELSHRIKNIFAVIAGLIALSARSHPEIKPLADDLRNRVMALGRAHDFVRPHSDASRSELGQASLHGMLAQLFAPYGGAEQRIEIVGEDTDIDDRAATPLALLFHELATNAAKYGALSTPEGHVRVEIARQDDQCLVHWRESGGPAIAENPEPSGFGSRLIALSVVTQLKGEIDKQWRVDGLDARITIPLESLHRPN